MPWRPASILLICLAASTAISLDQAPARADVLHDLGASDYAVRQNATHALLVDRSRNLDQLRDLYHAAATPEQRHRLIHIIKHHVIRNLREANFDNRGGAAVGFSHEIIPAAAVPDLPGLKPGGAVHVLATLPGFPGHAWLQPGDLIVELAGQRLPTDLTADSFQVLLHNYRAGERLTFTILRHQKILPIQLRLASIDALTQMYGNNPQLKPPYTQSWRAVRQTLRDLAPPIPTLQLTPQP